MTIKLDLTPDQLELIIGAMNDVLIFSFILIPLITVTVLVYRYNVYDRALRHEEDMIQTRSIWED